MMRPGYAIALLLLVFGSTTWAWSGGIHQKMVQDALAQTRWLDAYSALKVTPFDQMVKDVLGAAPPAGADDFHFRGARTREAKRDAYLASTAQMPDTLRRFARHLLLSNKLTLTYALDERTRTVSARQVLAGYAAEPDAGMDQGLDASRDQRPMGAGDPSKPSSQGFRHMSLLLGSLGEGPQRAQRFFDLGRRAIDAGHAYWGFRFIAWGLHYVEDMGTPGHTRMLPALKCARLKGMACPQAHLNRQLFQDIVAGSNAINSNYRRLYEHLVQRIYLADTPESRTLQAAVAGEGRPPGALARLFAPRSVATVARRATGSRREAPRVTALTMRYFGELFRQNAPGAPTNTVVKLTGDQVEGAIDTAGAPRARESARQYRQRLAARDALLAPTARLFRREGAAVRQAMELLRRDLKR
jgi:hypothetical protein